MRSAVLAFAHPRASTSSYLCSQFLANSPQRPSCHLVVVPLSSSFSLLLIKERKKENRQPKRGIGEEDRVHTCTSRILEGRSRGHRWERRSRQGRKARYLPDARARQLRPRPPRRAHQARQARVLRPLLRRLLLRPRLMRHRLH